MSGIDWSELKKRVAGLGASVEQEPSLSEAQRLAVLEARARELSRPLQAATTQTETVVRLRVEGLRLALPTEVTHGTLRNVQVTPVPWSPPVLVGVMAHRGMPLPVFHLGVLFGQSTQAPPKGPLLLAGASQPELALVTSEVEDVSDVEVSTFTEPPGDTELVRALLEDGTLLLDAQALFRDERLFIHLAS